MPLPKVRSFRRSQVPWPAEEVTRRHIPKDKGKMRLPRVGSFGSFRKRNRKQPVRALDGGGDGDDNGDSGGDEEVKRWRTLKEELLMLAAARAHGGEYPGLIELCKTIEEDDEDQSVVHTLLSNHVDIDDQESVANFIAQVRRERFSIALQAHEDGFEVTSDEESLTALDEWYQVDFKIRTGLADPNNEGLHRTSVDARDDIAELSSSRFTAPTADVLQSWFKWLMGEPEFGWCSGSSCNISYAGERQREEDLEGNRDAVIPRFRAVGLRDT